MIPHTPDKPAFCSYSLITIKKSILLVTSALNSLRGAVNSIKIFSDSFSGKIPAHTSIQNWILQYGVYELLKPVEKRDDWIYILDHTIEFGDKKCLLILGITQECFMRNDCAIKHEDMEVLRIEITSRTSAIQIFKTLKGVARKSGVPKQIISDYGADIKKAVKLFCNKYKRATFSYDITHKCALLLKHDFLYDEKWTDFIKQCSQTKRKILNSELGFLSPPNAKDKSRWLNLDTYGKWANNIISYRDKFSKNKSLSKKRNKFIEKFDTYFLWLNDYKYELEEWSHFFSVLNMARCEVKENGLDQNTVVKFQKRVNNLKDPSSRVRKLISDLRRFFKEETLNIPLNEKWLGTSDIIESIFGKYKNFSSRSTMRGIGKIILTIPVFTSKITTEKVKMAMETISIKKMKAWIHQNIGPSFFSKRRQAFGI